MTVVHMISLAQHSTFFVFEELVYRIRARARPRCVRFQLESGVSCGLSGCLRRPRGARAPGASVVPTLDTLVRSLSLLTRHCHCPRATPRATGTATREIFTNRCIAHGRFCVPWTRETHNSETRVYCYFRCSFICIELVYSRARLLYESLTRAAIAHALD